MDSSFVRKPAALGAAAALLFSAFVPLAARADSDATVAASPAGVGVARISYLRGAVAIQRGDSATPSTAAINAPVLGADYVTTGADARAEIEFDGTTAVRLGAGVQMRFTHLDAGDRELQLAEGTIELRLLRGLDGRSQIDTPSVSLRPRVAGAYRVSVDSAGRTQITVRSGSADVVTPQESRTLSSPATLLAQGPAASPVLQYANAIAYDDFDTFNTSRDQRALRALADAADYVAPGVSGVADLDAYGRWMSDTDYGHVWVPYNVAPGWAPYRDGRWAWEDNFGWTWIGYEPWGWAPYHYGRWYHHHRYGWCWYPDPFVNVWRPALVGFFTFGSGLGLGFGNIGWVPLGPLEPFNPWWGFGNNTTIVINNFGDFDRHRHHHHDWDDVARSYGNARYNGVTYVPRHDFENGHFEHRYTAPPQQRQVQIVRGPVPVVPTGASLRYSERPVSPQLVVRPALMERQFAGNPTIVRRTPFEQQRAAVATVTKLQATQLQATQLQRTPAQTQTLPRVISAPRATLTTTSPVTVRDLNASPVTERRANDSWARFGTSRGTPAGVRTTPSGVTVIDGAPAGGKPTLPTATGAAPRSAHDTPAWTRFDTSAPRTVRTYEAPARTNEPARTYSAPAQRYEAPSQTQRYMAPPQTQRNEAPPQTQRYMPPPQPPAQSQPQHHSAPPARTTNTTTNTSGTTPHH
jgi:FecR protein